MLADWKTYCRANGLEAEDDMVRVALDTGRQQTVRVEEGNESFHLVSLVAKRSIIETIADPSIRAWQLNRVVNLVGFRIDPKGHMIGECWVPKAGLSGEEFQLYVKTLASACDRFEHQLTGRDIE